MQLRFCPFFAKQQTDILFDLGILFLFDRQYRLECLDHRSAIMFFHPCRQRDQLRLDLYTVSGNIFDLLDFGKIIVASLCNSYHIAFRLPVAFPKRNHNLHSHIQLFF